MKQHTSLCRKWIDLSPKYIFKIWDNRLDLVLQVLELWKFHILYSLYIVLMSVCNLMLKIHRKCHYPHLPCESITHILWLPYHTEQSFQITNVALVRLLLWRYICLTYMLWIVSFWLTAMEYIFLSHYLKDDGNLNQWFEIGLDITLSICLSIT
jgi:hypothetical protein